MNVNILCLETSENFCSVALTSNNELIHQLVDFSYKNHSEILTVLIENLLKERNLSLSNIDAIAISKGPGSYTGLRIGVSVAKGICYSLSKPLIAINTLQIICYAAKEIIKKNIDEFILCPMIDARRMEVYMQFFDNNFMPLNTIEAKIIASTTFSEILESKKVIFAGSGAEKIESLYNSENAVFIKGVRPLAKYMAIPAYQAFKENKFEDLAYFEPYYLKNFIPTKSTKKNLNIENKKNFL